MKIALYYGDEGLAKTADTKFCTNVRVSPEKYWWSQVSY